MTSPGSTHDDVANFEALTPLHFLSRSSRVHADRIVVQDGDAAYTYAEWYQRANRLASYLVSKGIGQGDSVGVLARNGEFSLLTHYSVPMVGGLLVQMNVRSNGDDVDYIVEHSSMRLLFVSEDLLSVVRGSSGTRIVVIDERLEAELMKMELTELSPVRDELGPLAINYTSGTTSRPKGVVYHHRGAYLNSLAMALDHGLTADSSYLWTLPMFHCNGWCFPWATVAVGARNICMEKVDPEAVWELCVSGVVTHLCAAPTVLVMLSESDHARQLDRPVRIITAGAAPSPTILGRMEEFGFVVDHVYGLTETYGPFTVNVENLRDEPTGRLVRRARQGDANTLSGQVEVWDMNDSPVPADGETLGEIVMRGNGIMSKYHRDPSATCDAFRRGWFHTGDIGVKHPNGQVEIKDRLKDLIISGGENISTVEIERAIASHPNVLECAVVAKPDSRWGEVPVAFVEIRQGASTSSAELLDHCRERIAPFKVPKQVFFGQLPKGSTGKILKSELRQSLKNFQPNRDSEET
ncbi:MAG: AMP-binding protein [Actinobacteria bacterium]|nr:AMP-binding protein [Actinomycetota bacterium]